MNPVTLIFLAALVLASALQIWLARRHMARVRANRARVPDPFQGTITLKSHQRAANYTLAKVRLEIVEVLYAVVLLLGWTLGGGLAALDGLWRLADLGPILTGVGVLGSGLVIMHLLDLPSSAVATFGVETRYGFNRTTPRLFVIDALKEGAVMVVFAVPLAALVLWLMQVSGPLWWLWAWLAWIGFNALMLWLYPTLIAPLFNRFEPLEDAGLRQRIESLLARCGFRAEGIFVMDGSRRSGHGNAYFTGLGRNKRIVFFDTLLKTLSPDEVEAVLAHELGHYHHRHLYKHLLLLAGVSLAALYALARLMQWPAFYAGLGGVAPTYYNALMLLLLLGPTLGVFLQPAFTAASRRHEFEADAFAAGTTGARHLIQALVKLYKDNAATLTPDRLYSAFHDSHPPAPVRIAALEQRLPTPHNEPKGITP